VNYSTNPDRALIDPLSDQTRTISTSAKRRREIAKKTIHISDPSGKEVPEGKGAIISIKLADARKGTLTKLLSLIVRRVENVG
jgi:hypothetical protein